MNYGDKSKIIIVYNSTIRGYLHVNYINTYNYRINDSHEIIIWKSRYEQLQEERWFHLIPQKPLPVVLICFDFTPRCGRIYNKFNNVNFFSVITQSIIKII